MFWFFYPFLLSTNLNSLAAAACQRLEIRFAEFGRRRRSSIKIPFDVNNAAAACAGVKNMWFVTAAASVMPKRNLEFGYSIAAIPRKVSATTTKSNNSSDTHKQQQ